MFFHPVRGRRVIHGAMVLQLTCLDLKAVSRKLQMRLPCDAVLHSNNISLYQKDEMASNAKTKVTTAFERTKPENKSKAKPNKASTKLALADLRDCRCVLEHDPVSEGVLEYRHDNCTPLASGFRLTPHSDTRVVSPVSCA